MFDGLKQANHSRNMSGMPGDEYMSEILSSESRERESMSRVDLILDQVASFYRKHATAYSKKWADYDPNLPQFYDRLTQLLPQKGKLLDSGCGPGRDMIHLARKGFDVYGITLTQEEVNITQARNGLGDRVQVMDMRCLEFPSNTFDAIWDNAAFVHIPTEAAEQVLKEYNRVLRKEGVLFLRVKEGDGELEIEASEYDNEAVRFFRLYRQAELCDLVKRSGFKIIEAETQKAIDDRVISWIHVFARGIN
jgi:SAM-dependent methyltransferase